MGGGGGRGEGGRRGGDVGQTAITNRSVGIK